MEGEGRGMHLALGFEVGLSIFSKFLNRWKRGILERVMRRNKVSPA